jgi:CRP-like cAMP-binding protein
LVKGEFLHLAGSREKRVHFIRRGVLKLVARRGDGHESVLGLAVAGDLVGDIAALDDLPQPVDVIAATNCDLLGIDAETFLRAIVRAKKELHLAHRLAARLRWAYDATLERSTADVPSRLAGRLLHLADVLGRIDDGSIALDLPFAQTDVGRLAGICRESTCKTMRSFKREGIIDYRGKRLRILRPDMLERIRCGARVSRPSRSRDEEDR